MIRLNKYLAMCVVASRRAADRMIESGRVRVNGRSVRDMGVKIDPDKDIVRVDGKEVHPPRRNIYVLLNKPKGYVTTVSDERGRKTVFDLIKLKARLFPVGRLDLNSEGLLLLTNDGELAHRLMHPRFKISKTYRVRLDRDFNPDDFEALTSGIELEDGVTLPCKARFYTDSGERLEITIREGRNRQVKRMFAALGYDVKALKRIRFGPLELKDVTRGQWRYLTPKEIRELKKSVGLLKKN